VRWKEKFKRDFSNLFNTFYLDKLFQQKVFIIGKKLTFFLKGAEVLFVFEELDPL
jgi:hypothetical protein